ncbi:uncharacterized protein LOC119719744 [Patiria miniata]|uniref:Uncharacterized protein n=1 Tax=Patiria miniata TaxID=46514 RepID=A0A913Z0H8_PATMI|nr:uncharacterized protein LOC119719744 [Patiria miniata]
MYQVRRPADKMSSFDKEKGLADDLVLKFVKTFVKKQGYHKLHAPWGAKDMDEVIDYIYAFAKKLPDISIDDGISLVEDVLGVFLVGLTLEEIKDPNEPGDYKKVDDAWSIWEPGLGGNELYGQLYLLPQASILNVCDLVAEITGVQCPDKLQDLELPIIQGPAFPLFDYSRVHNSINDYSISSDEKLPINTYIKNKNDHSYVVFSNLWESDGNTALALDDCISKGNALGFDLIDWKTSTQRDLSKCCYSGNRAISLVKEGEVTKDSESNLIEYQLTGVFSFQCDSDGLQGSNYEPYGYFYISAGSRNINQNYKIWEARANAISLTNGGIYRQPFMVRFQESEHFMDEVNNKITLHGHVKEDDTTGDDVIGNYDGKTYEANTLSELKKLEFRQDSEDIVTIELRLIPVTAVEEPAVLKDYVLSGNFEFSCDNDGVLQNWYEPYGSFSIDIGNRPENQGKEVWHWVRNEHEVKCWESVEQSFSFDFKEVEDFMSSGNTKGKVILHGKVLELDTGNSDVIGDYDGQTYDAYTLAERKTDKFSPDYQDRVIISLQITDKTSAPAKTQLPKQGPKVVKMNSETERQAVYRIMHAIFPLNRGLRKDRNADKTRQEL